MSDPFDPMSPFFQDEFIFNEEDGPHEQAGDGDDCRQACPDCGYALRFPSGAETVRCTHCGGRFRIL